MSYLNNVIGYRKDLLSNRSIVKRGNYAVLEPAGLVKNVIYGFENCDITILASPKLGASFVDYLVNINPEGKNEIGFGYEGVETLFYLLEGSLVIEVAGKKQELVTGGLYIARLG